MEKCKKLKEYVQFIAKIREYLDKGYPVELAVDKAIEECIENGILSGNCQI